jgi:hypothetical protein
MSADATSGGAEQRQAFRAAAGLPGPSDRD